MKFKKSPQRKLVVKNPKANHLKNHQKWMKKFTKIAIHKILSMKKKSMENYQNIKNKIAITQ